MQIQLRLLGIIALTAGVVVGLNGGVVSAATLRVPSEHPTILAGLDAAADGDTVLVAPGTYTATERRDVDIGGILAGYTSCGFLQDGVVLLSEGGPGVTTISSSGGAAVLVASMLQTVTTAVVGFTIESAIGCGVHVYYNEALTVDNCVFADIDGSGYLGAAMQSRSGDLIVRNCTFERCWNGSAAGIWSDGDLLLVENSSFRDNPITPLVYNHASPPRGTCTILDSEFVRTTGGGGLGIDLDSVEIVEIRRCTFADNVGGGASIGTGNLGGANSVIVEGCLFAGNAADALYVGQYPGDVVGNTFWNNNASAPLQTGALFLATTTNRTMNIKNNIIGGMEFGYGIFDVGNGIVSSDCNVFWDIADGNWFPGLYTPGPNEIFANPNFCSPETGDYTVSEASPCLPGNNVCGVQIGAYGQGCGPLSIQDSSWGAVKALYRTSE